MKNYIQGYYAPSDYPLETLANKYNRKMLTALLNSYPESKKAEEIALAAHINGKTASNHTCLPSLVQHRFIKEVEKRREHGGGKKYVIENVNSLSRIKYKNYSLAPGNVEYSDKFKNAWNTLTNQQEIESHCISLLEFVKNLVRRINESDDKAIQEIAPTCNNAICSQCGLNHEARDFIRATLLYLLDQFERSAGCLQFLIEHKHVDKDHYEEYYKFIQQNIASRKPEIEQHRTINPPQELFLRLRIISVGLAKNAEYTSCLATNVNGRLIPVAVHKSLITKMMKVDSVIECVPSAILNNAVFLAKDNPHLRVLSDTKGLPELKSIPITKLENIKPRPGGMEIITGNIEANVVATPYEQPGPEKSRLIISDGTGKAGLTFKASFDSQIDSLNNYPGFCMPSLKDWRLHVDDRIRIVGTTSVNDPFYEGPRLTIELQPYSSLSVLKNGTEYEWAQ